MTDYTKEDIVPLAHFAWVWEHREEIESGARLEIPSPTIEGRTDHVVVLFGRGRRSEASGLIVRNRGRYSGAKSRELAERLATLLAECELSPADSCPAYDEGRPYYDGIGDPAGTWVHLSEHRSAPRHLRDAIAATAGSDGLEAKRELAPKKKKGRKGRKGK